MVNEIEQLREKLVTEKLKLEEELSSIGKKSKNVPGDWDAVPPETENTAGPDKNITADMVEGFEETFSTEGGLEQRLFQVTEALKRFEKGQYGVCRVCGKEIEIERLNANPAAATCIEHKNS